MGTPDIAVSMLSRIMQDGHEVLAVVTQPDKKVGRKQLVQMSSVKQYACEHDIKVLQPVRIKEGYEDIMQLQADLIVTCAYGQFIPTVLLEAPKYGSINVHASLLPKLRGGAPVHKAIVYGEKATGISIMRMVSKMDAGAVMAQCRVPILDDDTAGDLFDRLAVAGAALLSESIVALEHETAVFIEQDEALATFAYAITREEEYVHFNQDVHAVYNHIRGMIPYPIAYCDVDGKHVKFHKVRMKEEEHSYKLGEIVGMMEDGLAIAAKGGFIIVDEIQVEGKAKMDAKAFFNGAGKKLLQTCVEL